MKPSAIEGWALSVIDRVVKNQPIEDNRVELKSELSDPYKAARRIAAHANIAHGESILWLVGVDQKKQMVTGAPNIDFAELWSSINSYFNELAPSVTDVNVPFEGKTVLALLFATDRAPYVVRNPAFNTQAGGQVALEVPWREGTMTRSATRAQLLRLLLPLQKLPLVQLYDAELAVDWHYLDYQSLHWHFAASLYVVSYSGDEPVIFPFHMCEASIEFDNNFRLMLSKLSITPRSSNPRFKSSNVRGTGEEVIIRQAGMIHIQATFVDLCENEKEPLSGIIDKPVKARIGLVSAHNNTPVIIESPLAPVEPTLMSLQRGDRQRWVC